jgi:molecular chaperone HtpG
MPHKKEQAKEKQVLKFAADEAQVLNLVARSLYSDKDIFLREMISNASDALDKLRYQALSDDGLYGDDKDLKVRIAFSPERNTITISDNGIGMTYDETIAHLGTIARSGTKAFKEALSEEASSKDASAHDSQLIGQFGVGFYSAFVVADKVEVRTRKAGAASDEAVMWASNGQSDYTIAMEPKSARGTDITLFINDDAKDYLNDYKLKEVIHKFSDHIAFPIQMEAKADEADASEAEEGDKEEKAKVSSDEAPVWETVNQAKALWTRSKAEVSEEEYQGFYKHISHDFENPLAWSHNKVEGSSEYTSLLYIPGRAAFDLYQPDAKRGLKLYVKRVFIMEDADQMMPSYLRFVKGMVDADDLPLNISRELLQSNRVVDRIRTGCVKRVLSMLEKMAKNDQEQYGTFWDQFGAVLKEGPAQDYANKDRIAKLLRFASTYDDEQKQRISLEDYVARMKPDQDSIYFLTSDTFASAKSSPLLEVFREKAVEVLLLTDPVDEWLVSHMGEFEGKQLQSVAKGDINLDGEASKEKEEEAKEESHQYEGLLKQMKDHLGEQVNEVRLSKRLRSSPSCVVYDEADMGGHMQRLMQAMGQDAPKAKPILELNPDHALIKRLHALSDDAKVQQWSDILLMQAMLSEGEKLEDTTGFVAKLNQLWQDLSV